MKHKGTVKLETERLILRRFELGDSEAMFRNSQSDPKVPIYMTWKKYEDIDSVRNYILAPCFDEGLNRHSVVVNRILSQARL